MPRRASRTLGRTRAPVGPFQAPHSVGRREKGEVNRLAGARGRARDQPWDGGDFGR
ncbi:hypothetical protein GCM10010424_65810 [Streptomyces lienomycini]